MRCWPLKIIRRDATARRKSVNNTIAPSASPGPRARSATASLATRPIRFFNSSKNARSTASTRLPNPSNPAAASKKHGHGPSNRASFVSSKNHPRIAPANWFTDSPSNSRSPTSAACAKHDSPINRPAPPASNGSAVRTQPPPSANTGRPSRASSFAKIFSNPDCPRKIIERSLSPRPPRARKFPFAPRRLLRFIPLPVPTSTDLFDYHLPPELIAQTPTERRDASRLLVVDRAARTVAHHTFADLPRFLRPGDLLFRNNAAVLPARLHAHRPTGGQVECFLLRPGPAQGDLTWWCLLRPGKKLPVGATFAHPEGAFSAVVLERDAEGAGLVRFTTPDGAPITSVANRLGDIPLPPYITRTGQAAERPRDLERYQTVYADHARQVAVAAPTAGLHFTPDLLAQLAADGVHPLDLTLHVGLGTFKPIATPNIEEHAIHREVYELSPAAQHALFHPAPGTRRIAVGTTSVRTIEDFLRKNPAPLTAIHFDEAALYLYPPVAFRGVDALITNFHQPRSTLLCLVAAFLAPNSTEGIPWLHQIYAEAIAHRYRFFSYGDAMLIL